MKDTLQTIQERISANIYDQSRELSEAEIRELIKDATQSPSSFNMQNWRFIAVTDPDKKRKLQALAYGQQKVAMASATFIVLGDLQGYKKLPEIGQRSVRAGILEEKIVNGWKDMAEKMYGDNAQMQRDEAIRSGSLAAMTLMLAARARGLATGPMIGFDPEGVKREFNISDRYVPVMLVTVGYADAGKNWLRKPRLTPEEVLLYNDGGGFEK